MFLRPKTCSRHGGQYQTIDIIEKKLQDKPIWFKEHPQFQHTFHMSRQIHKYLVLWALILRTTYIRDNEW